MHVVGVVTLGDDVVGSFDLDEEERITIAFNKGAAGVEETLQFASDQGIHFGLMLKPEYGPRD